MNRAERRRLGGTVDREVSAQERNLESQAIALRASILARTSEPASQRLALVDAFIGDLESSPAAVLVASRALVVLRGLRDDLRAVAAAH